MSRPSTLVNVDLYIGVRVRGCAVADPDLVNSVVVPVVSVTLSHSHGSDKQGGNNCGYK